jgi:PTS system mannose-specific IIA component
VSGAPEEHPAGGTSRPGHTVPALLVMHGELAAALLHAAATLYGEIAGVKVISNDGLSKAQIEERIAAEVADWSEGGLVLTDFWGGSCHTCALAAARGNGEILLLTGVNMPMLLDYLHNRDRLPVAELAEHMQQRGRDNIRTQRGADA